MRHPRTVELIEFIEFMFEFMFEFIFEFIFEFMFEFMFELVRDRLVVSV